MMTTTTTMIALFVKLRPGHQWKLENSRSTLAFWSLENIASHHVVTEDVLAYNFKDRQITFSRSQTIMAGCSLHKTSGQWRIQCMYNLLLCLRRNWFCTHGKLCTFVRNLPVWLFLAVCLSVCLSVSRRMYLNLKTFWSIVLHAIWSASGMIMSSVCLSISLSVTLCIVAKRYILQQVYEHVNIENTLSYQVVRQASQIRFTIVESTDDKAVNELFEEWGLLG